MISYAHLAKLKESENPYVISKSKYRINVLQATACNYSNKVTTGHGSLKR